MSSSSSRPFFTFERKIWIWIDLSPSLWPNLRVSVSDVGLSGIGETNVTSVNVTQETQSPAIRRIYFKHHPGTKTWSNPSLNLRRKSWALFLPSVDSGHMPLFTEISDPARCARSHLVVSLIEEQTLYQCIRDQYQDQQSIFTLPWVAQLCLKLVSLLFLDDWVSFKNILWRNWEGNRLDKNRGFLINFPDDK